MDYQAGETVMYGMEGVCRIEGVDRRSIAGMKMDYYVLKPVYNDQATVLVPVKNQNLTSKMQPLLSEEEIHGLIHSLPSDTPWVENDNRRREKFKTILQCGTRREVIAMIRAILHHQEKMTASGRKLHLADERILKDAERRVFQEFAHVLNIEEDDVLPFIRKELAREIA